MNSLGARLTAIAVAVVIVAALVGFYVSDLLRSPSPVDARQTAAHAAQLTLKTEAAVGPQGGNRTWVSYLVQNPQGKWVHSTIFKVPAHSLVRFTVYQFDGDSGLRNSFLSQVHGTVGNTMRVDGKPMRAIDPEEASHTFAVPQIGLIVPLLGVSEDARTSAKKAPAP